MYNGFHFDNKIEATLSNNNHSQQFDRDVIIKKTKSNLGIDSSDYDLISAEEVDNMSKSQVELKNIIRSSIIFDRENSNDKSIWSSLSKKVAAIKNSIKYNMISTNTYVDMNTLKYIRIFDHIFVEDDVLFGIVDLYLRTFFYFSYRSDFSAIRSSGWEYTTDCGWGCMIRVTQMMLAKLIFETKVYKILNGHSTKNYFLYYTEMDKLRAETILLFFDNNLNLNDILKYSDFKFLSENCLKVLTEEESNAREKIKEKLKQEIMTSMDYNQTESESTLYIKEVTPPFSIQNICKLAECYDKGPGVWFSDVLMINIIIELNKQFQVMNDFELIHFKEGHIDEEEIISRCFIHQTEHNLPTEGTIKRNDMAYKFTKGGALFISVRLGLEHIEKEYIDSISHLFRIPTNLGIIGGKTNSAYHFIGETHDKLIYLDPHVNQISIKDKESLYIDANLATYFPAYIYQIDHKYISPAFTVGFYFRSLTEYNNLVESFKIHSSFSHPVFRFKEFDERIKPNRRSVSTTNIKFDDNSSNDFCFVEYEEL